MAEYFEITKARTFSSLSTISLVTSSQYGASPCWAACPAGLPAYLGDGCQRLEEKSPRPRRLDHFLPAIYVQHDYSDPGFVATYVHLDAVVALERSIAELGIYPPLIRLPPRELDPLIV
jgi:hypothetical protein